MYGCEHLNWTWIFIIIPAEGLLILKVLCMCVDKEVYVDSAAVRFEAWLQSSCVK